MFKFLLWSFPLLAACTGCSVYMAAQKDGVELSKLQGCTTRLQFMNLGATVLSSERLLDGSLVEVYQVPAEKGSVARAIMHGLLDLSTGFCWEIVGTPLEASLSKREVITIKVTYDAKEVPLKAEFV